MNIQFSKTFLKNFFRSYSYFYLCLEHEKDIDESTKTHFRNLFDDIKTEVWKDEKNRNKVVEINELFAEKFNKNEDEKIQLKELYTFMGMDLMQLELIRDYPKAFPHITKEQIIELEKQFLHLKYLAQEKARNSSEETLQKFLKSSIDLMNSIELKHIKSYGQTMKSNGIEDFTMLVPGKNGQVLIIES